MKSKGKLCYKISSAWLIIILLINRQRLKNELGIKLAEAKNQNKIKTELKLKELEVEFDFFVFLDEKCMY